MTITVGHVFKKDEDQWVFQGSFDPESSTLKVFLIDFGFESFWHYQQSLENKHPTLRVTFSDIPEPGDPVT